jgi:hypothetical protein
MQCGKLQSDLPDGYEQWLMPFFDKDLAECKLAKQLYNFPKYQIPSVMNQSINVADATQQVKRPFEHIYQMKQEWLRRLEMHKETPSLRFKRTELTPFQIAYYAIRKNTSVAVAHEVILGKYSALAKSPYKQSAYLRQMALKQAEEVYGIFYRRPEIVHYPSGTTK